MCETRGLQLATTSLNATESYTSSLNKSKHFRPSGDDGSRTGLQAAPAYGLSHGAAPADARVLDEGEKPEAQVLTHRQHPGQVAPQRRQPQGGDQHLLRVSPSPGTEEAFN